MSVVQQEHRAISIRMGLLTRADGSCQWTQGKSSVLVAVYGPHLPKRRDHILPDRAYISVKVLEDQPRPPHAHTSQTNPTVLKQVIHNAFRSGSFQIMDSLYPRSQITIVVQVINDDGAIFPCCLNAVSLALIDSGIQTADMLTAVGAAILRNDASSLNAIVPQEQRLIVGNHCIVIDPTKAALSSSLCEGEATFAWDQQDRMIVSWFKFDPPTTLPSSSDSNTIFWKCQASCKEACKQVTVFKRQAVTRKLMFEVNVSSTNATRSKARALEAEAEGEGEGDEAAADAVDNEDAMDE